MITIGSIPYQKDTYRLLLKDVKVFLNNRNKKWVTIAILKTELMNFIQNLLKETKKMAFCEDEGISSSEDVTTVSVWAVMPWCLIIWNSSSWSKGRNRLQPSNPEGLHHPLSTMGRLSRKNVYTEAKEPSHTIGQMHIMDTQKMFHYLVAEYTCFQLVNGIFPTIEHIPGHEASLNKFKITDIIPYHLYDHSGKDGN